MVEQQLMIPSSFQLDSVNLLVYVLEDRKKLWWKMGQQTLAKRGIKIPSENTLFFTPTK
jgi:hypothetical protein